MTDVRRWLSDLLTSSVAGVLVVGLVSGCTSSPTEPHSAAPSGPNAATSGTVAPSALPGADQTVRITAGDDLKFSPHSVSVRPGRVRVILTVSGSLPQTFTAPSLNVDTGVVQPGKVATIDVNVARPGKYEFFSAYHKTQGMRGVLVVK
jgi:plastocyanin